VPKVLEQRLLINDAERKILKTIEEMSPRDTGNIYVMGNPLNLPVPTLNMLSQKLEDTEKNISKHLENIGKKWGLPEKENLPTGNGVWDKEHAYINAIGNQHKLRWDEKLQDYRVPRIHMFSALQSTGTLIANNEAFEGEKIVRQSLGLDEKLNSYHIQDGIMPEIIEIFGKAKNQRALLTGTNKTGKPKDFQELESIKKTLEIEDHRLSDKDWKNIETYVLNTIDSFEEAAKSVAHEHVPLFKNIPEHVDVHLYFGANDFANMKEMENALIAHRRRINNEMEKANKNLHDWRDKLADLKYDTAEKNSLNKEKLSKLF
jgi:hypothetical protein